MSKNKKRNIIIGSLCAVVLLMAVGYAAFQTVLNISGTSNIMSSWSVKITGVTTKNIVGTASNNGNPTFENLSATFKTNLQAPGDSIEYDITVKNEGTLNAKLDDIVLSDTNNPAIKFTASGMTKGDVITAGSTKILTVKVEYISSVSEQPTNTTSTLTVDLDYSQATGTTPSGESAADKLIATAVTTGDGLYADTYEEGRYVYKGASPNNFITFNGEPWRIMAVEADGTLKIRKNGSIRNMVWDSSNSNNWARPATLNTYLNNDYYNSLSNNEQSLIQSHAYGVGAVTYYNTDLTGQIADENATIWTGNIGLMSVSDYLRANTNIVQCGNFKLNSTNNSTCKTTNYLFSTDYPWTFSPATDSSRTVFLVDPYGLLHDNDARFTDAVWPVLHLKSDISLTGEGTQSNPYTIR